MLLLYGVVLVDLVLCKYRYYYWKGTYLHTSKKNTLDTCTTQEYNMYFAYLHDKCIHTSCCYLGISGPYLRKSQRKGTRCTVTDNPVDPVKLN
jgi:hypothetical protein